MPKLPLDAISPVQVRSVAEHVIEQLENLIVDGTLAPGDQLPSEIQLSTAFGVGRSTVREAKQVLIAKGLVVTRGRTGAFVVEPSDSRDMTDVIRALQDPSHDEIYEVRRIVEIAASRLAAERVTVATIRQMRALVDEIEEQSQTSGAWSRSLEVHRALVHASGNGLLATIYDLVVPALQRNQIPYLPLIANWQKEVQSHRRLVDVLADGDPDAMAREMRDHLTHSEKYRQDLLASGPSAAALRST
jgi:GntR family transcriptional repressor for pyruvate dehydrogenase complex